MPKSRRRLLVNCRLLRKFELTRVRRLFVNCDIVLEMKFSAANLCQNQGAGCSWIGIFIANWCPQKCVGYSRFAILGWKWRFRSSNCAKIRVQVTRDWSFSSKIGSAKVRRLLVIGNFRARLTAYTHRKRVIFEKVHFCALHLLWTYTLR